jgi:hypothetical protein
VRVHRAGEGAPFAGLKPAGLDLGPAVPAADRNRVNTRRIITGPGPARIGALHQAAAAIPTGSPGVRPPLPCPPGAGND